MHAYQDKFIFHHFSCCNCINFCGIAVQLNKGNTSNTEASFLDLCLSISNDNVSNKIYNNRDDFDFEIVNFKFRWRCSSLYIL